MADDRARRRRAAQAEATAIIAQLAAIDPLDQVSGSGGMLRARARCRFCGASNEPAGGSISHRINCVWLAACRFVIRRQKGTP